MKLGNFDREKPTLKMLPAALNFDTLYKRFRSFYTRDMGSVGQRAAKLLTKL